MARAQTATDKVRTNTRSDEGPPLLIVVPATKRAGGPPASAPRGTGSEAVDGVPASPGRGHDVVTPHPAVATRSSR